LAAGPGVPSHGVNKLAAVCGPSEDYGSVIIRMAAAERSGLRSQPFGSRKQDRPTRPDYWGCSFARAGMLRA
jgi:hypothetical protein